MSVVQLASYKGPGNFSDALVRMWTRSEFSHCELVLGDAFLSCSLMDGGVRTKLVGVNLHFVPERWELLPLPWADEDLIQKHFFATAGEPYSLWDLVRSQVFNHNSSEAKASFCSKWCAAALQLPNPVTYSPRTLREMCVYLNAVHARHSLEVEAAVQMAVARCASANLDDWK